MSDQTNYAGYRFDHHLSKVSCHNTPPNVPQSRSRRFTFTREERGADWFLDDNGRFEPLAPRGIEGVHIEPKQGMPTLHGRLNEPVSTADIAAIRIRMRADTEGRFRLSWRTDAVDHAYQANRANISFPLISGHFFHTYQVKTLGLRAWLGNIEELLLLPSDAEGSVVEVDHIALIDRIGAYESQPYGLDLYEAAGELRKALYARTPSELAWDVDVPENAVLAFGLAMLERQSPVRFQVWVDPQDGTPQCVFDTELPDSGRWADFTIDMTPWAGHRVSITLSTSAADENCVGFWANPGIYEKQAEPKRVFLYLIDCMRADSLDHGELTAISNLKVAGVNCTNYYVQANWTRASIASLFTSQYPAVHGVTNLSASMPHSLDILPEILQKQGFHTVAFICDNGNISPAAGLHRGFDRIIYGTWGGSRKDKEEELRGWLLSWATEEMPIDRNLFVYVHSLGGHAPYAPKAAYERVHVGVKEDSVNSLMPITSSQETRSPVDLIREHFLNDGLRTPEETKKEHFLLSQIDTPHEVAKIRSLYDALIQEADETVGLLIELLQSRDVFDDTVLMVTSDHGEMFKEHGLWQHGGEALWNELIHVPFIITGPGQLLRKGQTDSLMRAIDVMPTLLDIVGIPAPLDLAGRSLKPLLKGQDTDTQNDPVVFCESNTQIACINGDWKMICPRWYLRPNASRVRQSLRLLRGIIRKKIQLYNLKKDTYERTNLAWQHFFRVHSIVEDSRKWISEQEHLAEAAQFERLNGEDDFYDYDARIEENLRALGYID